ncbi:MAG TPA: nitrogenase component 1 [Polyangiaceae bacterium]|jgi:hypothetical protein|nr:MAG: Nitrogenase component 1 type Oxidoreductase [Deltaproteobacteria bacterium ADurb.Bin207]HNS99002.1 nitrogenase component 1 [Polyangiaceae bacterium]HNZ22822.1 nitrogenase component 1 [Polyangiaceae bacterium]HOD24299.1 nitrogenase component 1 [Polyangiaceae bacterium]HOE51972.1 nitrogenase component 1 [Polyangiaceae bacterium]
MTSDLSRIPRYLVAGPDAVAAFHHVFGISPTLRANGTYVLSSITWKEGMLRVCLTGRLFGRAMIHLQPTHTPGQEKLTVKAESTDAPSHPQVERLVDFLHNRLKATPIEDLLDWLRRDPKTEAMSGVLSEGLLGGLRAGANLAPKPYAHTWTGKPGEVDQWGLFFDDLVFVFTALSRVNFVLPTTHVVHGCHECTCVTPKIRTRSFFLFYHPRRPHRPAADWLRARLGLGPQYLDQPFRRISTNMNEVDTVRGAEDKLMQAVALAATGQGERIVAINATCLPKVMGEDVGPAISLARNTPKVHCLSQALPLTHDTSLYTDELEFGQDEPQVMRDLLLPPQGRCLEQEPDGKRIDLVGFPDGPDTLELVTLLERCGAVVNALLLPDIDVAVCRRTPKPNLQVRFPNPNYTRLYHEVFDAMADQIVTPPAPYGIDDTRQWITSIAHALSLDDSRVHEVLNSEQGAIQARWDELSAIARKNTLGFVVDQRVLPRLTDPDRSFGLSLARIVREMGFGIEVLCYAPEGDTSYARHQLSDMPVRLTPFQTPLQLQQRLREGSFRAVYSDRTLDRRLTRAGQSQFSYADFEMGLAGALRSLHRLVRACALPFYHRYASLLAGEQG